MFDLKDGWNISFAGCGFLGIYHIGVASCLLEQAPYLVKGASKIYGASAGALTASMLASGASIAKCCEDVVEMAKEARRRNLGPMHPSFNLLKVLRAGLIRDLPADAHVQASGRLCVSLTRVSDGQNELVSHFDSKEELIQALICSCFIPIYCGLIPPSFRGVRYVDGGMSNNLPRSEARNTITISPFAGESDVCPRDGSFSLHELHVTNNSIHISMGNVCRMGRALSPPEPKGMAKMCQNGYGDALRFLRENNLVRLECPTAGLTSPELKQTAPACCCRGDRNGQSVPGKPVATETTKEWVLRRLRLAREHHWWLDERIIHTLPTPLKKVLCEACREKHSLYTQVTDLLPVRMASYMLLPAQSAYSMAQRLVEWIPEVAEDAKWLYGMAGAAYRQAWRTAGLGGDSDVPVRKCLSMPPTFDLQGPLSEWDRRKLLSCMDLSSGPALPAGPAPSVDLQTSGPAPSVDLQTSGPAPSVDLQTPGPAPGQMRFTVGEADESDPASRTPDRPDAWWDL